MLEKTGLWWHLLSVGILGLITPVKAQIQSLDNKLLGDSSNAFAEISTHVSTSSKMPFWFQANQFGIVPSVGPVTSLHGMLEQYWPVPTVKKKHWRVGGGVELVGNLSEQSRLLVPQMNIAVRFKNWEFSAGRKKQWIGLADSTIGMGSYSWSTNAMPIPKLQIGTRKFIAVPLSGGWISFHGFYSEGLFESGRATTSQLKLHQKILYLRIGKEASRFKLYGGINHQVQWGGRSPYQTNDGKMPAGIKNYFRVLTGKPGDANKVINVFDDGNRVGNHLGTVDLGMEIETFGHSIFLYRQNIYEDGSLYALTNITDGLNGLRIRRKNSYGASFEITEAVVEFLFTKSQGGSEFSVENYVSRRGDFGRDNYFNNAQIRDGWSYYNRTIGTPFITPTSDTDFRWPRYADSFSSNNRVSVCHLGLKGSFLRKYRWSSKLSYSTNIGTYDQPFSSTVKQFSGFLSLQGYSPVLGGILFTGALAADVGKLYRLTYGLNVGVRKYFRI